MIVLEVSIFCLGIEAGAELADVGEVTMALNDSLWVAFPEILEQEQQGNFLGWRTGIGIVPLLIDASFIAHTNGMTVIVLHMGTCHLLRTSGEDLPITVDVSVVANAMPALSTMPAVDVRQADTLAQLGGGAVHHNEQYFEHWFHIRKNRMAHDQYMMLFPKQSVLQSRWRFQTESQFSKNVCFA